jgi:hypothetical protein
LARKLRLIRGVTPQSVVLKDVALKGAISHS